MNSPLPLSGIRVVDLTRVLSGPFCSMLLGDLGADIVKVETPGEGDTVRHQGAGKDGLSWYFANYNRLIFRWTPIVTADFCLSPNRPYQRTYQQGCPAVRWTEPGQQTLGGFLGGSEGPDRPGTA